MLYVEKVVKPPRMPVTKKELDRRRKVRHLRKEYEEESDAKGSDGIGQDRSVREADGSVTKCQLSDTVAQG